MKRLLFILPGILFNFQVSQAQAPINTPDNMGSGNCLDFDGVNDRVDFSSGVDLGNRNQFTIEMWLKLNDNSTTYYLYTQANTGTNQQILTVETTGSALDFHFRDNTGSLAVLKTLSNPPTDVWHHVAVVRRASNSFELYLNGVLEDTDNTSIGTCTFNNYHLGVLDRALGRTGWYDGQIDELRIWSIDRSQSEIRDDMSRTLNGNETGLLGYWNMNEGTGGTVNDLTTNNHHGTLQ